MSSSRANSLHTGRRAIADKTVLSPGPIAASGKHWSRGCCEEARSESMPDRAGRSLTRMSASQPWSWM